MGAILGGQWRYTVEIGYLGAITTTTIILATILTTHVLCKCPYAGLNLILRVTNHFIRNSQRIEIRLGWQQLMHIAHRWQAEESPNMQACSGHVKHAHDHAVKLTSLADLPETQPVHLQDTRGYMVRAGVHHPAHQWLVAGDEL